jgi:ribonuclease HI
VERLYVVTAPERIRGIYSSWADCRAAVEGARGARYQRVASREHAEALLRGDGTSLGPGLYGFVDGNHLGGVGVVVVKQDAGGDPQVIEQMGATVIEVFLGMGVPALGSALAIRATLARLRNVLAELGALHLALRLVPEGAQLIVVHDYEGVGAWIEGRWRAKDPVVREIVEAASALIARRRLTVTFRHQRGHQSTWAGRDDFAYFNARADALATEAARDAGTGALVPNDVPPGGRQRRRSPPARG